MHRNFSKDRISWSVSQHVAKLERYSILRKKRINNKKRITRRGIFKASYPLLWNSKRSLDLVTHWLAKLASYSPAIFYQPWAYQFIETQNLGRGKVFHSSETVLISERRDRRLARSNRLRVGLAVLCCCNGDPTLLWNLKRKQFSCRHFKVNLVGYYRVNEILLLQSAIVLCKLFSSGFRVRFFYAKLHACMRDRFLNVQCKIILVSTQESRAGKIG